MKTNEGTIDRIARVLLGSILLLVGYFWTGGWSSIVATGLGAVFSITGIVGVCGIYKLFKFSTVSKNEKNIKWWAYILLLIALVGLGSPLSIFITKKWFIEDFGKMNNFYKQTLFLTGQNKREEAKENYKKLTESFAVFKSKYANYRPYSIKQDSRFEESIDSAEKIINDVRDGVESGDLEQTHKKLEEIRPIFQDMFKRNGFSMVSLTLVDFHDVMEVLIEAADEKNPAKIIETYPQANKLIEEVAMEIEVKDIINNLDGLYKLAQENQIDQLAKKAGELKTSFVKVYLVKG